MKTAMKKSMKKPTKNQTRSAPPPGIEKVGMVSSHSVKKATGRDWQSWLDTLNKAQAKGWDHRERTEFLKKKHKLSAWWQQQVAIGYEVLVGLRMPGENYKGEFSLTITKTLPFPAREVWNGLCSEQGSMALLSSLSPVSIVPKAQFESVGGVYGEIRTLKNAERVRLSWNNEEWSKVTYVTVMILGRAKGRTMFVVQHEKLKTAKIKAEMRGFWKECVAHFVECLNSTR